MPEQVVQHFVVCGTMSLIYSFEASERHQRPIVAWLVLEVFCDPHTCTLYWLNWA